MAKNNVFEEDEKKSIIIALVVSAVVVFAIVLTFVALIKYKGRGGNSVQNVAVETVAPTVDYSGEVIVTNQEELDAALQNRCLNLVLQTEEEQVITIEKGDYSDTVLMVDAPFTTIENNAVFAEVVINQISANTWLENAEGNRFYINAPTVHLIVNDMAKVKSIENVQYYATLAMEIYGSVEVISCNATNSITSIQIDGSVGAINVYTLTYLTLSGKAEGAIPVNFENGSSESTLTTTVTLVENLYSGVESEYLAGAENSQINIYTSTARNVVSNHTTDTITVATSAGDSKTLQADEEYEEGEKEDTSSSGSSGSSSSSSGSSSSGTSSGSRPSTGTSHASGTTATQTTTQTTTSKPTESQAAEKTPEKTPEKTDTTSENKKLLEYVQSLLGKVDDMKKDVDKLAEENEKLKAEIETISKTLTIAGYPVTRAVVEDPTDAAECADVLPKTLSAYLATGGTETVEVTWGTLTATAEGSSVYVVKGTISSNLTVSEEAGVPTAYLYVASDGYQFATRVTTTTLGGAGTPPVTESEDLYIILHNAMAEQVTVDTVTQATLKECYLFPISASDSEKHYEVTLHYYYFGTDKKQIFSLGTNAFLEHSGDPVVLGSDEEEESGDGGSPTPAPGGTPADPTEAVPGAYWDPAKLIYKYCVVEVEVKEISKSAEITE